MYAFTQTETNWGGYAYCPEGTCVQNDTNNGVGVNWIQAEFSVPTLKCTQNCAANQGLSVWVGIGGLTAVPSLFQAGVEQDWNTQNGLWEGYAFWGQKFTNIQRGFGISAGDRIWALVYYGGSVRGMQQWIFSVADASTGANFTHVMYCGGQNTSNCTGLSQFASAEWITEAPGDNSGSTAELPAYKTFSISYLQYGNTVTGHYSYLGNTSSGEITPIYQNYLGTQSTICPGSSSTSTEYFCQNGVYPTPISGTGRFSTFQNQYLVGAIGIGAPSVTPISAAPGSVVTGTVQVSNPVGSTDPLEKGASHNGAGGVTPVDLSLEMEAVLAGGGGLSNTTVRSMPYFGTYDPVNGWCYVADYNTSYVSVVANGSVIASIRVGGNPLAPTFDPFNDLIYVPLAGQSNIAVVLGKALFSEPWNPLTVGSAPHSVTFDPANGKLYVPNWGSSNVSIITGHTVTSVSVGSQPLFATVAGGNIYVPNSNASSVSIINASSQTVTTVAVGLHPHSAVLNTANGYVYIENTGSANVTVLSGTTIKGTIAVGSSPQFAAFDPQNDYVYVANSGGATVSVISGLSVVTSGTVGVGTAPLFPFYDTNNSEIYVSDSGSSSISVIGGSGGVTVVGNISVELDPHGITMNLQTGALYVFDGGSASVTSINSTGGPGAKVCLDPNDAPYVGWNLTIGTANPQSFLDICGGLPAGIYLFTFIVWWGGPLTISGPVELAETAWSYFWGKYLTVT